MSVRVQRQHNSNVVAALLRRRGLSSEAAQRAMLHELGILPDMERVSRPLAPTLRDLKRCLQRDRLAKAVRARSRGGVAGWLEGRGRGLVKEGERVRLALCGDVKRLVRLFEGLRP
jgi:transposase